MNKKRNHSGNHIFEMTCKENAPFQNQWEMMITILRARCVTVNICSI